VIGKTVLLIDDEPGYIEALADALEYEGYRVLKAVTAEEALNILAKDQVHCVTVDIMLPQGRSLEGQIHSHQTGIMLCKTITSQYPQIDVFCLSVVSSRRVLSIIKSYGVRCFQKGETPLSTVLDILRSRLTGLAYSTDPNYKHYKH
jgi:two-component system nitrogen regulation response regulator NtrX